VASTYFHKLDGFAEFHERIKNVTIENDDFEKIIRRYDSPVTFFFLDPPYLEHSVKGEFLNMSEDDHKRLVEVLLRIEGRPFSADIGIRYMKSLRKLDGL
jgi:DNA adenine methylase